MATSKPKGMAHLAHVINQGLMMNMNIAIGDGIISEDQARAIIKAVTTSRDDFGNDGPLVQCSFCGSIDREIHPLAEQHFGEPLCVPCFNETMREDPTND